MINGFINLYKEKGVTSNYALTILKNCLNRNSIYTKAGHFGTLDPLAEGVLPIALGRAARLFELSQKEKKEYYAVIEFGKQTDTLDSYGTVVAENSTIVNIDEIKKCLPTLIGDIKQLPPKFSAKLVGGKRAYKLAREGVNFQLKKRLVTIYDINQVEDLGENCFSFYITCSSGTYIRSIARDLGELLGTYGTLVALKRTVCGSFSIDNSVTVENIEENIRDFIMPMEFMLGALEKIIVDSKQRKQLLDGIKLEGLKLPNNEFRVYDDKQLIGIGKSVNGCLVIKPWLL